MELESPLDVGEVNKIMLHFKYQIKGTNLMLFIWQQIFAVVFFFVVCIVSAPCVYFSIVLFLLLLFVIVHS